MFIRLTGTTTRGEDHPTIISVEDISGIKPVPVGTRGNNARTIISLRSNPEFPVWSTEPFAAIEAALRELGVLVVDPLTGEVKGKKE